MKQSHIAARPSTAWVFTDRIAEASRDAPHMVSLLRQFAAGKLLPLPYSREFRMPQAVLAGLNKPALVMINDLDGGPAGPDAWAGALDAIKWARHVVVCACAPKVEVFAAIGVAAELGGRSVLIETASDAIIDWLAAVLVWNPPVILQPLAPPYGESYPAPDRANLN